MKGVLGKGWAPFWGKGVQPTLPPCSPLQVFHVTRRCFTSEWLCERCLFAPCCQASWPRKIIQSRLDCPVGSAAALRACGVLSLPPHQHMRPCTCFAAFLHCPCLRERATGEPTQIRSGCQGHMLRRKHDPASRLLTLEHLKARTWMAHMQTSV